MVKNNKNDDRNFFSRLVDVIDMPLFLGLAITLISVILSAQDFYLDYVFYAGAVFLLLGIYYKGWAGYRAAKYKEANIKPWVAGLLTALIVSIFSVILSVVSIVYFPNPVLSDMMGSYDTDSTEINSVSVEEDFEYDEDLQNMGKGGWDDPMLSFTLLGSGVSVFFSCLFGALFGLIGGAIGKD